MTTYHSKPKRDPPTEITAEMREKVIDYFLTNNNNTIPAISKALDLTISIVSRIINKYLDEKFKRDIK